MSSQESVTIMDETFVEAPVDELGDGDLPSRFAIVPHRLVKEDGEVLYYHKTESITLRKLFEREGISETRIEEESLPSIDERDATLLGPILYFSSYFIINHWDDVVSLVEIIQTYAKDRSANNARLNIEYETPEGESLTVRFDGDTENLPEILEAIKSDYSDSEVNVPDLETTDETDG